MSEIRTVAVLGAGTMGHGIAQVSAAAGCDVRLYDINAAAVAAGMDRIRANLEKGIARGKVTEEERDGVLQRLQSTTSIADAAAGADLIVEAAPELMDLKAKIFAEVDAAAPDHAILASNTSSLSIAAIADSVSGADRFVGMHFFNPVHIMALVEVVWGPKTSDATRDAAVAFAERLGKVPIVVKDAPGFASLPPSDGSAQAHRPGGPRCTSRHRRVPERDARHGCVRTTRATPADGRRGKVGKEEWPRLLRLERVDP
jgi:3-hydroxybutyryl-CoA dehydrogenase